MSNLTLRQSSFLADPAAPLHRLVPDKIVDGPDFKVYWFARGPKKGTDFAMLIVWQNKTTFRVQYYPKEEAPQIVEDLTMDRLSDIIEDLINAGFPVKKEAQQFSPRSSTAQNERFLNARLPVGAGPGAPLLEG